MLCAWLKSVKQNLSADQAIPGVVDYTSPSTARIRIDIEFFRAKVQESANSLHGGS
jgi:hypothetical protein